MAQEGSKTRTYFPFKQGYPFVATIRVGSEGIQMTVDGKHITSFAYREVISLISYSCNFYNFLDKKTYNELICSLCRSYIHSLLIIYSDFGAMAG